MAKTLEQEFKGIKLNKKRFQKLEKEILNDYHKTHEFTMPKQNNSPAVYDYGKIKEKFAILPEISDERIAEKLRKTKEYKKANEENFFSKIKKFSGVFVAAAVLSVLGYASTVVVQKEAAGNNFKENYSKALIIYADTNKDNFISNKEKEDFGYKLLNNKRTFLSESIEGANGAQFYPAWPKGENGEYISVEQITEWIEEYKE